MIHVSKFSILTLALVLAPFLLAASLLAEENWTRFRGENGQGISAAKNIPTTWTEKDYNWKIELPGSGNSSPVVWGDKVFLMCTNSGTAERTILCIEKDSGKTVWSKSFKSETHRLHSRNTYASCTPAVNEKGVYVAWSSPEHTWIKAFTHDGKEMWSKDLGRWVSQHGFGTSPMIFEDMLIISNSQQGTRLRGNAKPGESNVIALNCTNGEQIWKTSRGSQAASYAVPCIYTAKDGKQQLICCSTADGMYSLDPKTGKANWSSKVFSMRTVASPVFAGDIVFGSTGSGGGGNYVVAMKIKSDGVEELYRVERNANYVPTPVVVKDMIFLWYDRGIVSCVDTKTGKIHYRERLNGEFSGSPVVVGEHVYCISDEGTVFVIKATKEFKLAGEIDLGERSRATPAVAANRMYLRTDKHLMSLGK